MNTTIRKITVPKGNGQDYTIDFNDFASKDFVENKLASISGGVTKHIKVPSLNYLYEATPLSDFGLSSEDVDTFIDGGLDVVIHADVARMVNELLSSVVNDNFANVIDHVFQYDKLHISLNAYSYIYSIPVFRNLSNKMKIWDDFIKGFSRVLPFQESNVSPEACCAISFVFSALQNITGTPKYVIEVPDLYRAGRVAENAPNMLELFYLTSNQVSTCVGSYLIGRTLGVLGNLISLLLVIGDFDYSEEFVEYHGYSSLKELKLDLNSALDEIQSAYTAGYSAESSESPYIKDDSYALWYAWDIGHSEKVSQEQAE